MVFTADFTDGKPIIFSEIKFIFDNLAA